MISKSQIILRKALLGKYAVGAFNFNNLEMLQAIVAAAESQRAPVIVQTSEGAVRYAGMDLLSAMAIAAAKHARVPVVLHLDHGKDAAIVREAIMSGYTSVMFDGSALPYDENVAQTKKIVKMARAKNVAVEAELGAIKGVEDLVSIAEREAAFTNPEQALDFVERTGCDSLAISIGTAHGAFKSRVSLDIARLRRIRALIPKTPLVLHGASSVPEELVGETKLYCSMLGDCARIENANGIPDKELRAAIAFSVAKVNTDTDLRIAFTAGLREAIVEQLKEIDPRKLLAPARQKMQEIAEQRIRVFGSAKKA